MTDKDLLVVISEMLRKQDQQAELLSKQAVVLNHHTQILTDHTRLIKDNNDTLKEFVDVSIKEFEWQHRQAEVQDAFNKQFLSALDQQAAFNEDQRGFNKQFLSALERQQQFNERFLAKLDEISNKL